MSDSVAERLERQMAGTRLRVLIVGAGIAGATLGALMRQRGEAPAIIERGSKTEAGGYMIGLMPLGGRVLNGLGLAQDYERNSIAVGGYAVYRGNGQLIRRYELDRLLERFGSWRGIERGTLLGLLRQTAGPIAFETTITGISEAAEGVAAVFHDGSRAVFDLIVGTDGMHSAVRGLIIKHNELEEFDTGWGGFVLWSSHEGQDLSTYSELWSAGWGIGLYPVPGRIGMFLAGRDAELRTSDAESYARQMEDRLPSGIFRDALQARDPGTQSFYWKMADCRSKVWSRGRTVLLGDAAAAFLPTAGVGASAAMDSAAALADELSRADTAHLAYALELYEKRQRHRVEISEKNSRQLSRLMFVNTAPAAWARDHLMEFYTLEHLIKDISKVMAGD